MKAQAPCRVRSLPDPLQQLEQFLCASRVDVVPGFVLSSKPRPIEGDPLFQQLLSRDELEPLLIRLQVAHLPQPAQAVRNRRGTQTDSPGELPNTDLLGGP